MRKIDFNRNWTFKKTGEAKAVPVILPHDAMIQEVRSPENPSGSAGAYFPGGIYEYEKKFEVLEEWENKEIIVEFEGIYKNASIYVNDVLVKRTSYGYTENLVNLSQHIKFGEFNYIRVIVNNQDVPNSRWYTGSGIYRPVWLHVLDPCHIELNGIRIKTLSIYPPRVEITVLHQGGVPTIRIFDQDTCLEVKEGSKVEFTIEDAKLWSETSPYLYNCRIELKKNEVITDATELSFGIRMIEWTINGLLVNGKETLLRGGCVHHDNGIVGACAYAESEERRVRILKQSGFNAIRSSHNPCSRAFLEACDQYGVYVIDETWDMWFMHKSKYDYAAEFMDHYLEDIKSMVEKDYNHPSVIFYSIGNEIAEPASEKGMKIAKEMIAYLHESDSTRGVTAGVNLMIVANASKGKTMYKEEGGLNNDSAKSMSGMNSTMFNMITQAVGTGMNKAANSNKADLATSPILDALDVAGYNYASGRYAMEGKKHPKRILYGSETFPQALAKNWKMVKKYPYLIGDFMWTAWDYIGEAGIGAWSYHQDAKVFDKPYPWLLADAGIIDILGNPCGEALHTKAIWGMNKEIGIAVRPVNHPDEKLIKSSWRGTNAIPSWSWKNCMGNQAYIEVYSRAKTIDLILNGKKIGRKKTKDYKCIFKTRYQPGHLLAVGYDKQGVQIESGELVSAEDALMIRIHPEKERVVFDEIVYLNVDLCDSNNTIESNADEELEIEVEGGELLGFGSANPRTEETYLAGRTTTYYGRALAVIRVGNDNQVRANVTGKTLKRSCITLACRKA